LISQSPTAIGHDLPSSDLPSKPTTPPAIANTIVVGRLATVFAKNTGNRLNRKAGSEKLLALAELIGTEQIEAVWESWLKTRNLEGMECPLVHFVNEFAETEALMQKVVEDARVEADCKAAISDNARRAKQSEILKTDWMVKLNAVESLAELERFVESSPAPLWFTADSGHFSLVYAKDEIDAVRQRLEKPTLIASAEI